MIERIRWSSGGESIDFEIGSQALWIFDPADFSHTVSGRFSDMQPAGMDGKVTTSANLDGAYTRFDVLLNAPTISNAANSVYDVIEKQSRRLYRLFCPSRAGRLTVEQNGRQYAMEGYPASVPTAGKRVSGTAVFTIELNHDAPAFSVLPEHKRDIFSKRSSAYLVNCLPMRLGTISSSGYIINDTDIASPVSLVFSGQMKNPMVTNLATKEYMAFDIEMNSGDELAVTTGAGQKKVTLNGIDASGRFAAGSSYLLLAPGAAQLSFSAQRSGLDAKVLLSYSSMVLGV